MSTNARDLEQTRRYDGITPLYATCLKGQIAAARLCLERGASYRISSLGEVPATARAMGYSVMAAWLARIVPNGWKYHLSEPRYSAERNSCPMILAL